MSTLTHDAAGADAGWEPVCRYDDLLPERGAAALVAGVQVALVRTADGAVHAVANRDPFSGANVMSRGIVGSRAERATLASPMYKQVFDLETGDCLDAEDVGLRVFPVRLRDGLVEVGAVEAGTGAAVRGPDPVGRGAG